MAINVSQAFHRTSANPIDDTLALTNAEMLTVNDNLMPSKYITISQTDGKIYLYDKTNEMDPETGKFRVFEGGGKSISELTDVQLTSLSDGQALAWDDTNSKWVNVDITVPTKTSDLTNDSGFITSSDVPANTSELTNDSGFITKAVNDLVNYYLKSEAYNKTEVDTIVAAIKNSRFEVVSVLPTEDIETNVIYLVPSSDPQAGDSKDEYINLDGTTSGWEKIGSTDIDLSGYVTTDALNTALADYTSTTDLTVLLNAKQDVMQVTTLPTASADLLGKVYQYIGTTGTYTHGYFYECVSDGESSPTYSWEQTDVQPSSGGGGAELEAAVTSNLAVGAIASGTTLEQGTTFTEFVQKLLITEIAPTTTFTASGSGIKEVGTSVIPTLTLVINTKGTGTPTAIKFYDGSTLLDTKTYVDGTNTYTFTMDAVTTTRTVKGVLEYKKSNDVAASVEKSATYTFVMASYYGAVTTAPTDKAGIVALTKNVKNSKAQTATFTLSNQRSCYCYPASFGNLTSIKDANNFEYLSSYTKTNVTVDEVSYNVYTLTDPVTATGFKQVYA